LISFLNGILYQGKATIVSLIILDPYQAPRIKGMKDSFLDIKATLSSGQTVIIEMQVLNILGFVFVELPKFTKTVDELKTLSDKWIYFLRYANELKAVPASMGAEAAIGHAFEVAQQSRLTRREMKIVEKRQMVLHDNRNALLYCETRRKVGGKERGKVGSQVRDCATVVGCVGRGDDRPENKAEIEALRSQVD